MSDNDAVTISARDARIHEAAYALILGGHQPTADALLRAVGGSKQTVLAALRTFWTDGLRARIFEAQDDSAPPEVIKAANELWALCATRANDRAAESYAGMVDALDDERRLLEDERRRMMQVESALRARIEKLLEEQQSSALALQAAQHDIRAEQERTREAREKADALARDADDLRTRIEQLESTIAASAAQRDDAARRISELESLVATERVAATEARSEAASTADRLHTALAHAAEAERQLADLRTGQTAVAEQVAETLRQFRAIQSHHATEITRITSEHDARRKELNAAHDAYIGRLQAEIDGLRTALRKAEKAAAQPPRQDSGEA